MPDGGELFSAGLRLLQMHEAGGALCSAAEGRFYREGLEMRPVRTNVNLYRAAAAHPSDWMVGINAHTVFFLLVRRDADVGRVQTPRGAAGGAEAAIAPL